MDWLWSEDYEKALGLTRKSSSPCHICILFSVGSGAVNFGSCSKTKCAAYFAALCKCHYRQEAAGRPRPTDREINMTQPCVSYPASWPAQLLLWMELRVKLELELASFWSHAYDALTPRGTTTTAVPTTTTRTRNTQSMSRRKYEKCKTKIWQKLF